METAPTRYRTVMPRLVVDDVASTVGFLREVFGAEGDVSEGRPSEIRLGECVLLVSGTPEREAFPAFLYVYVEDVDATFDRALAAGAACVEAPLDTHYGERCAMVRDAAGNVFQVARPIDPAAGGGAGPPTADRAGG